jgi:hypothetical protein
MIELLVVRLPYNQVLRFVAVDNEPSYPTGEWCLLQWCEPAVRVNNLQQLQRKVFGSAQVHDAHLASFPYAVAHEWATKVACDGSPKKLARACSPTALCGMFKRTKGHVLASYDFTSVAELVEKVAACGASVERSQIQVRPCCVPKSILMMCGSGAEADHGVRNSCAGCRRACCGCSATWIFESWERPSCGR